MKKTIVCLSAVLFLLSTIAISFAERKSTALEKVIKLAEQGWILNSAQQQELIRLSAQLKRDNPLNADLQIILFHLNKKVLSDISNLRYLLQDVQTLHALAYTETLKRLKRDDLNLAGKHGEELRMMLEVEKIDFNQTGKTGSSQEFFDLIDGQFELLTDASEKSILGYWKFWEQKTKPIYKSWHKKYQEVAEKHEEKRQRPYPLAPILLEERKFVEAFVPLQVLYRRLSEPASADF
jgi:hypothetical protein